MQPSVSIVLPNLNTSLPFLKERVETIVNQTFTNWECIVADGFSTNGSWEYLKEVAEKDARFKCHQFPKEGIYKAWNAGLALAKGEYIYIAPSDDTMDATLLEKMAGGLQQYPECAIAHCCLKIIDEHGNKSSKKNWDNFSFAGFDKLSHKKHIRYAPYDGVLYCALGTIYTSITQLLIKKEVFEKIGYFLTDQGVIADFEWGMRAGFAFNTLHIPEYLATWRIHDAQATDDSMSYYEKYALFIRLAADKVNSLGLLKKKLDIKRLQYYYIKNLFLTRFNNSSSASGKLKAMVSFIKPYPYHSLVDIFKKTAGMKKEKNRDFIKKIIKKYDLGESIKILN